MELITYVLLMLLVCFGRTDSMLVPESLYPSPIHRPSVESHARGASSSAVLRDSMGSRKLAKRALLPYGPNLLNFPSQAHYDAANTAVVDMWRLSLAALAATSPPTSSYYRYFGQNDLCNVRNMFQAILGPEGINGPVSALSFRLNLRES